MSFHDISISRPATRVYSDSHGESFAKGAPVAVVRARRLRRAHAGPAHRQQQQQQQQVNTPTEVVAVPAQTHLVSISHDGDYSTAMCLAYRADLEAAPDEVEEGVDDAEENGRLKDGGSIKPVGETG